MEPPTGCNKFSSGCKNCYAERMTHRLQAMGLKNYRIRDKCLKVGVPFFFKQWGGVNKKKSGRVLDGRTWNQFPKV